MALLLSLCNPKKPFVWTVECQHASEGAKSLLLSSPELAFTAAAHTLYSMCLAEWNRWNSISDMLVLLRNPILSSSLTSLHACSPPTPPPQLGLNLLFPFGLSIPVFQFHPHSVSQMSAYLLLLLHSFHSNLQCMSNKMPWMSTYWH